MAFFSNMPIAAIRSRGDTTGSSMIVPSFRVMTFVLHSRAMLVRISTISVRVHSLTLKALSTSPGMKKLVRPSPPLVTIA